MPDLLTLKVCLATHPAMVSRFLLLYGSQTGQAEAIAEQIRDGALSKGLSPELHCLDKSEKTVRNYLAETEWWILIVS